MQSEAELNQLKLEQCCRSHWRFDNSQKPRCWSRIFSEHEAPFLLCWLPLSMQKLLLQSENLFALKQTCFSQLWESGKFMPYNSEIQQAALDPGIFYVFFWSCLHWVLKLKLLTGVYESLWQPSASVRKFDGPIAVI